MGGDSYGFQQAGYDVDLGLDNWKDALLTFRKHIGAPVKMVDLEDYYPSKKDYDVIIVGGTPCQDFSTMNTKHDIFSKRAQLVLDFCRVVSAMKPVAFVFENVMSIPKWVHAAIMDIPGYKTTLSIVDSVHYGVPQNRRRKVFIGARRRHIKVEAPLVYRAKTVREAFAEIPENWGYMRHMAHTLEKFRTFKETQWTSNYEATFSGTIRLKWDEPSCAVVNVKKAQMLHPSEDRVITLAEALALQGFPNWFIPEGSDTSKATQIANAVPPGLARNVAEVLKKKAFN